MIQQTYTHNLEALAETLKKGFPPVWSVTKEWRMAFNEYNEDSTNPYKLGMGCRPCYHKVLVYLINKSKNIKHEQ